MRSTIKKFLTQKPIMNFIFLITNFIQNVLNYILYITSPIKNNGKVSITFDDALISVYENAYPIMQKHNVVGNVAVIINEIGNPGYMTLEHLKELQDKGWSIVSHTMSHPDLKTLDEKKLDYELIESRSFLLDNQFTGFDGFVVPFHHYNKLAIEKVKEYYSLSRNESLYGMKKLGRFGIYFAQKQPLQAKHELRSLPIADFYKVNQGLTKIRSYIKYCIKSNKFADLYTHGLNKSDIASFEKVIQTISKFPNANISYNVFLNIP